MDVILIEEKDKQKFINAFGNCLNNGLKLVAFSTTGLGFETDMQIKKSDTPPQPIIYYTAIFAVPPKSNIIDPKKMPPGIMGVHGN